MNIDQYNRLQPRIVDLQRAALEFAELGLSKVSRHILAAVVTAQKIKPTKPASADSSADAAPAPSPKRVKGA
ncbi:hypothetical protein NB688_002840 [Xanthomonas sacchari]|uniref:Uncharacterized protein n=1 Tax=Xanthomonas sacchari TaxID=56458 RepID=A0ABT3DWC8_9XANT|nr:hypothetical protein [Xanthomonas sacchari]MCW0399821.1 hypothetical protein [Xanthomonas sacchari]MCW0420674.1 hypothetical protein [Xanthomonas sacchari]UYK74719.1 hypothetical protein NG828_10625 [Xanthomonas sacchari]